MNDKELNALFEIAATFAERTYKELFNQYPDTSKGATQELLDALMQAWLTGYAYLRADAELNICIENVFGFIVESEY